MKTYKVNEIFYSVQGEGTWAGQPMVFVRFAGCNLKCSFCDTQHQEGRSMAAAEIKRGVWDVLYKSLIQNGNPPPICFTGGEPTLQLDNELISEFNSFPLHLETNGTNDPVDFLRFQCITVSPKTALTKDLRHKLFPFLSRIGPNMDLKIVWDTSNETLLHGLLKEWSPFPWGHRFIQPMYGIPVGPLEETPPRVIMPTDVQSTTNVREVLKFIMHNPQWRLSLQLQRLLQVR